MRSKKMTQDNFEVSYDEEQEAYATVPGGMKRRRGFFRIENFIPLSDWKHSRSWKEYGTKAKRWAWNPERKAWLWDKFSELNDYPHFSREIFQILVGLVFI